MDVKIGIFCSLVLMLSSCGEDPKSKTVRWDETETQQAVDPMSTYMINCSSCHGEDGKLGASQAADLSKSTINDKEILEMINKGNDKGMMPYEDVISLEERKALVPFVKALRK